MHYVPRPLSAAPTLLPSSTARTRGTRAEETSREKVSRMEEMAHRKEETEQGSPDTRDYAARIFTRRGSRFAKCQKMRKKYRVLLEMNFSLCS